MLAYMPAHAPKARPPSGAKHENAGCVQHIPHPYTTDGWLCVSENETPEQARGLADYLGRLVAAHTAREVARRAVPALGRAVVDQADLLPPEILAPLDPAAWPTEPEPRPASPVGRTKRPTKKADPSTDRHLGRLSSPPKVKPSRTRPSCPRCGRTFRTPTGCAWHVEHWPTCAKR